MFLFTVVWLSARTKMSGLHFEHAPSLQNGAPIGHTTPHPPQYFGSAPRLRHTPLQPLSPPPQHAPLRHERPVEHTLPHAPQFCSSPNALTQFFAPPASSIDIDPAHVISPT